MRVSREFKLSFAGALALTAFSGCVSGHQSQSPTMDVIGGPQKAAGPFVEGFIEYAGPRNIWAGPQSVVLHVAAKDAATVEITVTPDLVAPALPEMQMGGRGPANARPPEMTTGIARSQLEKLANAAQDWNPDFQGCLSPLRVRLVRADGSLLEKQGCRDHRGWAKVASEVTSLFLESKAARVVAAAPVAVAVPVANDHAPAAAVRSPAEESKKPDAHGHLGHDEKHSAKPVAADAHGKSEAASVHSAEHGAGHGTGH